VWYGEARRLVRKQISKQNFTGRVWSIHGDRQDEMSPSKYVRESDRKGRETESDSCGMVVPAIVQEEDDDDEDDDSPILSDSVTSAFSFTI
jgi:hypothetical protein